MFLIIGFLIVFGATLGGFMIAGGQPAVLLHVSEFVTIGGMALGVMSLFNGVGRLAWGAASDRCSRRAT